ncbi:two-component regulator propeller domain-containing protein [Segetibacter koreensis]|uniref:two-component regulator propeller domain-containing protein n=1 Tax=Segetibacter koreensis TaxID=398037 RepID=UPI000365B277|nr:two-component regulator propeller domain-containing protein [Segetibacter koreensis]
MKKQSNQNRSLILKLLAFSNLSISFLTCISCNKLNSLHPANDTVKIIRATNIISKPLFPPPKVTTITPHNPPKKIKAGKPVIKIDAFGRGIPFFTNYRMDQGLPVDNVICSASDKAGNLWFGTGGGGVSKFDGKSFTTYTVTHGLAGNVVFYVLEDQGGNLWFGTTSGVSKYDGYRFTNYTTANGLADNFVTCIMQDSWGNLWFATHEGGVSKYDSKSFTNYNTLNGLPDNYVRSMIEDTKGNIWFGTDAGGVSKFDGSNFTNYTKAQGLANNSVNSISQDKEGNLWFGTNAGVSKYDWNRFTNYTIKEGLADNNVFCIVQDKDDNLWFGTHTRGVSKYDGTRFTNYTKTEGLAENKINSILQDRVGNLWISSQGGGVSKFEGNSFSNYTTAQGLAANLVFWILQDKSGNLWFGTYEGGASKYDGNSFTNYTKAQGLADNKIWAMMQDKAGNIWFGTDRGVSKFDGNSFTNYTTAQGLASDAVITIMQDKAGNIWFGTRGSGVSKYDGNSFTNYTTAQGLAGNNIWSIAQDKAGSIWFGTHGGGASRFDGNSFTNFTTAQGLPSNLVSAIHQDKVGNIWFGTDGKGISKYDGKTFTNYTTEQGLADNGISIMAEDKTRNIMWFGTTQGLSGLKENRLNIGSGFDDGFENFTKNTGYPVKDVSTGALCVDDKGIVWVASGEGKLIRFDYSAINKKDTMPLSIKIQSVKVNNENICWNNLIRDRNSNKSVDSLTILNETITSFGKVLSHHILDSMRKKYEDIKLEGVTRFYPVPINLVLPYNYNSITIDFVAIEPAMAKQVKYKYKLEGYNNDWSPLSNNSNAVFGNMSQGNYTFRMKALSPFGVWSEKVYTFKVLPPWWATWWAYALYAFVIGGVGYTSYRIHMQGLERKQAEKIKAMAATQEEERKRISRDLHDDIGARLTNINLLSALGQQKISEPQEMSEYLKRISREIQTSAEALDDIVWSIDSKNDLIEEVTSRMRRYAADVFDETAIRYTIRFDEKTLPAKLSIGKRRDLFFVFKETINNIQKHALATEVNINIEVKDNELLMQVSDNGKGFDPAGPTHRNGLKNIQQRVQKWGGTSTVESSPGKGVILKITLPVLTPSLKRGIWKWFKSR